MSPSSFLFPSSSLLMLRKNYFSITISSRGALLHIQCDTYYVNCLFRSRCFGAVDWNDTIIPPIVPTTVSGNEGGSRNTVDDDRVISRVPLHTHAVRNRTVYRYMYELSVDRPHTLNTHTHTHTHTHIYIYTYIHRRR